MTTIYHNPRCSKSRAGLELLKTNDIDPVVVLYLENPPNQETLKNIASMLDCSIRYILRKSEDDYKYLGLADDTLSEQSLLDILANNPKLLERPIVVKNDKAAIGRPTENILSIL